MSTRDLKTAAPPDYPTWYNHASIEAKGVAMSVPEEQIDKKWLDDEFEKNRKRLACFADYLGCSHADREDLVQACWIRMSTQIFNPDRQRVTDLSEDSNLSAESLRSEAFKSWAYLLMRGVVVEYHRFHTRDKRDVRRKESFDGRVHEETTTDSDPYQHAVSAELISHLPACLEELDERYNSVIRLVFYSGLEKTLIAEQLGISLQNLRNIVVRALPKLKICMEAKGHKEL